jgi:hypothetical protein
MVPVLGSMLLEISGQGECLLASHEDALEEARGLGLVSHHMFLKVWSLAFDDLATELALKLLSIEFRLIVLEEETFVIVQHVFLEIGNRIELLLAVRYCALDDSWLSRLVALHVLLKIVGPIKTFATQLAGVQENWVHSFHMHLHVTY